MNNLSDVVILMATYNGEQYLEQQLNSIFQQTFRNWNLIISDDGSKDNTIEILKRFQARDSRIIKIINNVGEHGAFANYFNAIRFVKNNFDGQFKYFFYCDQDDIWLKNKMEFEIEKIKNIEDRLKNIPIICYSDLSLMDSEGKLTNKLLSDYTHIQLENPYNIFFSHRYIWGTTMVHNKSLWDMLNVDVNIPNFVSHDHYIGKYAASYGKICYLDRPLVNYRRHGENVSGVPQNYNFLSGLKRAITKFPLVLDNHAGTYWTTLFFIRNAPFRTQFLDDLQSCLSRGGLTAWKFIKKYKICTSKNKFNLVAFKLILYTGIYKHTKYFKFKA